MTEAQTLAPITDGAQPGSIAEDGPCLVVADRGHVWIAQKVELDDDFVRLTNGRAVRRWGTSQGLNELAKTGPLPKTIIDAPANLKVSRKALIAIIPCEADKWTG